MTPAADGGIHDAAAGSAAGSPAAGAAGTSPSDGGLDAAPARSSLPLAATCAGNSECASGYCVDGTCCRAASCGTCESCATFDGTCGPVTQEPDDDTCPAPKQCGRNGTCLSGLGAKCSDQGQCASGVCASGVCCDRACGACEACNASGMIGICSAILGEDPTDMCMPGQVCASSGLCFALSAQQRVLGNDTAPVLLAEGAAAQVFTFSRDVTIVEVHVRLSCSDGVPQAWLENADESGQPSGTRVAEATVEKPASNPANLMDYAALTFASPVSVAAGARLAVVLQASAGQECWVYVNSALEHEGGEHFVRSGSGPWTVQPGASLIFQVLVR